MKNVLMEGAEDAAADRREGHDLHSSSHGVAQTGRCTRQLSKTETPQLVQ